MTEELALEVLTPLGFVVRCTRPYWDFIVSKKHPTLAGRERDVERVLADPDQVRRSRKDQDVLLFSRLLITAYPTDSIKAGETIWTRSS
jgi:hypothetical protein